jgi:hypothetical protein
MRLVNLVCSELLDYQDNASKPMKEDNAKVA